MPIIGCLHKAFIRRGRAESYAMDRRTVLAGSGVALSALCGGCLGNINTSRRGSTDSPSCDATLNEGGPSTDRPVAAWSRNDVPPYDIAYPENAESAEDWNPAYLGEQMSTSPSIDFRVNSIAGGQVHEPAKLRQGHNSYLLNLIETKEEREAHLTTGGTTDFDESVLVLVSECCGSSSVEHQWVRVEETTAGLHLYGYLRRPYVRTSDLSPRYSLLEIDRPADEVEVACASLTVREDQRIHFDSTDDVVSLVAGVLANDRADEVTGQLRITTADNERRVDGTVSIDAHSEWKEIGLIGETTEAFTVELTVDALDIDVTEEYRGEKGTLGIRIQRNGEATIGPSTEI